MCLTPLPTMYQLYLPVSVIAGDWSTKKKPHILLNSL